VGQRIEFIPPLHEVAACIHAEQSLTFLARERRRIRADTTIVFALVPLNELRHAEAVGHSRGEWLVWQDHTRAGIVGRIPAGGGEIAAAITTPDDRGRLAGYALNEVMDAVWRLIAD
jgi:hypothetical protein